MNRDEILVMTPGRELDALVAEKVMGYEKTYQDCGLMGVRQFTRPEDGKSFNIQEMIPNYSTDISAAWEVVRKFTAYELTGITYHTCKLWKRIERKSWQYQATTAPEAICKAALLAVMEVTP